MRRTHLCLMLPEQITGQGEKINGCAAALMTIIISPSDVDQFGQSESTPEKKRIAETHRGVRARRKTTPQMQIRIRTKAIHQTANEQKTS